MSPLQKIAMGLLIVFLPAYFPGHPHPEWAFYDALPDPIGWILVLIGVRELSRHLDVDVARWLCVAALAFSIPLWFPQVNHLLVPKYNPSIEVSFQWFISLPQMAFGLALVRTIGQAGVLQKPRDTFVAGRFGVLTWGLAASILLPVIAYGADVKPLVNPSELLIGLVDAVLVYYLFRVHRRTWLGGPGPLEIHPRAPRKPRKPN